MSVCNISFGQDEILLLTDTLQYTQDKKPAGLTDTKAFISDNNNFAWTIRGSAARAEAWATVIRGVLDFDTARRMLIDVLQGPKAEPGFWGIEANLFGWSDAAGKLRAVRLTLPPDGSGFNETELSHGIHLAPAPKVMAVTMPPVADAALMVKMAMVQFKVQERHGFAMCVGGEMHITSIRREGCRQWLAGAYPDLQQHLGQFSTAQKAAVA